MRKQNLSEMNFRILYVTHEQVAAYLSASDFGIATVKPTPSKKYCSVTKVGEYLPSGLPVIITNNIGDDSDIISNRHAGFTLSNDWMHQASDYFETMMEQMASLQDRYYIRTIAESTRSLKNSIAAYSYFQII